MKKVIKGTNLETMATDTLMLDPVIDPESYDVPTTAAVAAGITEAVGGASDALQEQIDDIAEKAGSGYTPKGPASVATLNGLTGQENGWLYTMTDAGTLTDGSVAVVAGNTVAWDATNSVWYKAMDYIPSSKKPIVAAENNPASLNDLKNTGFYQLQRTSATTTTNFPSDFPTSSGPCVLEVFASTYDGNEYIYQSITRERTNEIWFRAKSAGSWSTWTKASYGEMGVLRVSQSPIIANLNNPTSLNDLQSNGFYQIQKNSSTTTTDFPADFPTSSGPSTLLVLESVYNNHPYVYQVLTRIRTNEIWVRTYSDLIWTSWVKSNGSSELTVGSGGQFNTLRSGIAAAILIPNCKVRVLPGTYDLKTEFADKIPDVLDEKTVGIELDNGVNIFFDSGAKVVAEFDTDDGYSTAQLEKIAWFFNPFYGSKGDYTLENLDISCKNTRYCVHDENNGQYTYKRKYINCKMKYTNTLQSSAARLHCIGCGLGEHGSIFIEGGFYEVVTNYGLSRIDNGDVNQAQMPIMIHNGSGNDNESTIYIKNVYLADRGFINFRWGGDSPNVTNIYICGCSLGLPTFKFRSSNSTTESPVNMDFTEWGCEVRNSGYHWELDADNWNATLVAD